MKTKMKTMFVFFLAAAFAVSCGKNESSNPNNNIGFGNTANLTGEAQNALTEARNWYNASERNIVSAAMVRVNSSQGSGNYNGNTGGNCLDFELFGQNINLGCYSYYYGNQNNNNYSNYYGNGEKTCFMQNGQELRVKSSSGNQACNFYNTSGSTVYNKSQNQLLKQAFTTTNNEVVINAQRQYSNGRSLIIIYKGINYNNNNNYNNGYNYGNGYGYGYGYGYGNGYGYNNNFQPTKAYIIDTSVHSVYNPVQYIDYQTGQTLQTMPLNQ